MTKDTVAYIVNIDGLSAASNTHNKDFMFSPEDTSAADVAHYEAHAYFKSMERLLSHTDLDALFDGDSYYVRIELLVMVVGTDDVITLIARNWTSKD